MLQTDRTLILVVKNLFILLRVAVTHLHAVLTLCS